MKILFICRNFDNMAGGVERMAITIMNEMVRRGHDVAVITWDPKDAVPFYKMDKAITWHKLNIGDASQRAGIFTRLRRAFAVRALVRVLRPDIAIGFQHGTFLGARLFTLFTGLKIIAAERNAPDRFAYLSEGKRRQFVFQSMRLAKAVTIQCESYRQSYPSYLHGRMVTIPNPVFPTDTYANPRGGEGEKILLSVGRLSYQKNYPVLLDAFARLADDFPDWTLVIAGEGEDRAAIEEKIAFLQLTSRVRLAGAVQDVASYYRAAQLFCLPSLWEGFPNALAEALSHGLPAIGFAQCAGVRDLILDGENGLLAAGQDDADTLCETLRRLIGDDGLRVDMGARAIKSVEPYKPELIFDQWEKLFSDMARG